MIEYNYQNMLADAVGKYGISFDELKEIQPRLKEIHQQLVGGFNNGDYEFAHLPDDKKMIKKVKKVASSIKSKFENLIVVGIGGSDLGAQALLRAFRSPLNKGGRWEGLNVYFLGATTDPEEISEVLTQVDLRSSAINIISKSGGTIEPMSAFLYLRQKLIEAVGFDKHGEHIIATTDPESGILKALMDTEGHQQLSVPQNLGGRFSVLSVVGLFPAACAGIDIHELLKGAGKMNSGILKHDTIKKNDAMAFAALQYLALTKHNQNISIIIPYSIALSQIGVWYRQLWAESLGKAKDLDGHTVNVGQTPIAALGPTDQHSQLQLWNEGPYDKTITFMKVKKFRNDLQLPDDLSFIPDLKCLEKKHFGKIMNIELEATAQSLTENSRPNSTITIPEISEENIGELFMFFEWAVVYMGALLKIDAFNQPGVERSKQLIREMLELQ